LPRQGLLGIAELRRKDFKKAFEQENKAPARGACREGWRQLRPSLRFAVAEYLPRQGTCPGKLPCAARYWLRRDTGSGKLPCAASYRLRQAIECGKILSWQASLFHCATVLLLQCPCQRGALGPSRRAWLDTV
jgi:hypothetical protein